MNTFAAIHLESVAQNLHLARLDKIFGALLTTRSPKSGAKIG